MVWFSIFATVAIVFAGAWYAGMTASQWKELDPPIYTEDEIKVATYASYVLYAVGGLLTLLFLFMRKRIQLAMGCVKEASKVGRAFVESAAVWDFALKMLFLCCTIGNHEDASDHFLPRATSSWFLLLHGCVDCVLS